MLNISVEQVIHLEVALSNIHMVFEELSTDTLTMGGINSSDLAEYCVQRFRCPSMTRSASTSAEFLSTTHSASHGMRPK